jgi:hypothetical protein
MYAKNAMDPTTQYILITVLSSLLLISEYLGTATDTENKSIYNLISNALINALNTLQQRSTGAITPQSTPIIVTQMNSDHNSSTSHTRDTPASEL